MDFESPEALQRKIEIIKGLDIEAGTRADLVLVVLGYKPATDFFVEEENVEKVTTQLRSTGLTVGQGYEQGEEDGLVELIVASSPNVLSQVRNVAPAEDPRRYGQLMGYPDTAVEAFALYLQGDEALLSEEDRDRLQEEYPFVWFVPSREHFEDDMSVFRKWAEVLWRYAPQLIDENFDKEEAKRYKQNMREKFGEPGQA